MVLLDAQIANCKTRHAQGGQQLVTVVLQSLQPGARSSPHGESGTLQPQRPTVGCQLGPSQAGPALPQGCEVALTLPLLLEALQTLLHGNGRGRGCRQQHRARAEASNGQPLGLTRMRRHGWRRRQIGRTVHG